MSLTSSGELSYSDFSNAEETDDEVSNTGEEATESKSLVSQRGVKRKQQQPPSKVAKGLPTKQARFKGDDDHNGVSTSSSAKKGKESQNNERGGYDEDGPTVRPEEGASSGTDDDNDNDNDNDEEQNVPSNVGREAEKGSKSRSNAKKKGNARARSSTTTTTTTTINNSNASSSRPTGNEKAEQQQQQHEATDRGEYSELRAFYENCDGYCALRKWAADRMISMGRAALGKDCAEDKVIARDELEHEKHVVQEELLGRLRGELREALVARHAILSEAECRGRRTSSGVENAEFMAMLARGVGSGKKGGSGGGGGTGSSGKRKGSGGSSGMASQRIPYGLPDFSVKKDDCTNDFSAIDMGIKIELK